ncbi:MAG: CoA transferase [Actinomycetota bacterium]
MFSTDLSDDQSSSRRRGPLEGILVADFSRVLAGPLATMTLADLGADVVKVEAPIGDDTRAWGPPYADGQSTYFQSVNRNKRSIALDLREPDDHAVALELIDRADVMVENFKPGTLERFDLGWEQIHRRNPRLVLASITGFGTGPGAELPGYDLLAQAVGGLMSITGPAGGEPTKVGVALVDVLAGLWSSVGILAALRERDHSGAGHRIEVCLLDALLASLVNQASAHLLAGTVPKAMGNRHPSIAPYATYACADGPLVVAVGNDRQFSALCAVLGKPEMADDPRFGTNSDRVANHDALTVSLEALLAGADRATWSDRIMAVGVPCGAVHDLAEAFAFAEQMQTAGTIALPGRGEHSRLPACPIVIDGTTAPAYLSPPDLDQHGEEVRAWLAR